MTDIQTELNNLQISFYENCDITQYTTMKIGGKVRLLMVVSEEKQLCQIIPCLYQKGHRFVILGGGSNVVFPDSVCESPVIINHTSDISKTKDHLIRLNSGTPNQYFLKWCIDNGIGGLEFLGGIPGTIGGAVAVNAGSQGESIEKYLERAEIFTEEGEFITVSKDFFKFSYRNSSIKFKNHIIINVYLSHSRDSTENIRKKVQTILQLRKERHPSPDVFTAGCFFKNISKGKQRISSGQIIDSAGLKGHQIGNIRISDQHANFFINDGNGTLEELTRLEKFVTQKVSQECGVVLEREVIYISHDGSKY